MITIIIATIAAAVALSPPVTDFIYLTPTRVSSQSPEGGQRLCMKTAASAWTGYWLDPIADPTCVADNGGCAVFADVSDCRSAVIQAEQTWFRPPYEDIHKPEYGAHCIKVDDRASQFVDKYVIGTNLRDITGCVATGDRCAVYDTAAECEVDIRDITDTDVHACHESDVNRRESWCFYVNRQYARDKF